MGEHNHGALVIRCGGCGRERWCGFGPCRSCGEFTPCPVSPAPNPKEQNHE